jgi:hypothetical protein
MLNKTASHNEQKNETKMDKRKKKINVAIFANYSRKSA